VSPIVRIQLGILALGAGLVHLALAAGSPGWLAAALVLTGAVEFAWGMVCFASGTPPIPRAALVVALVPMVAWLGTLIVANAAHQEAAVAALRPVPMATASLFDAAVAVGLAIWLRRGAKPATPDPHPLVFLAGVALSALVVASIATPAIALTESGDVAPAHHFDIPGHGH
jgi:hypothetical protein